MQINGPNKNTGKHLEQTAHRRIDSAEAKAASPNSIGQGSARSGRSTHVTSPELKDLKQQLQNIPEVRTEIVSSVANRVAAGEFSGFDIAKRTASAMLDG